MAGSVLEQVIEKIENVVLTSSRAGVFEQKAYLTILYGYLCVDARWISLQRGIKN